ncbi:MAG TPA: cupin domain-containing protein [Azospirillaceae bacterium]|nr:cupin domain-containing protein [Azospirillaceae bacterium]
MAFGITAPSCVTKIAGFALAAALALAAAPGAQAQEAPLKPSSKVILETSTWGDGAPIEYPAGKPLITSRITEIPPGTETGRHRHPIPLFAYMLEGELTIQPDDQPARVFKAGDAFMELSSWHTGQNKGTVPVRLLAVYAGAEGTPLSIKP